MGWTTPRDVNDRLRRTWDQGRLLAARVSGEALFPLQMRLARPDGRALGDRFDEVRSWIRALEEGSRTHRGFGYEIEWVELEHRQLGRNRVPRAIVIPSEDDALALIGKRRDATRFQGLADATLAVFPALKAWIGRRPLRLLEHAEDWERILAVVTWFRGHARPGVYMRQIDVPGVDTKFIESRKELLSELFDLVLPPENRDETATGVRGFEQRYGLRQKPPLVRFRILDSRQHIGGLTDLATPAAEFARLALPARRVFVTENDVNGLAFPDVPDSLVIFGLGYGLERLSEIPSLRQKAVFYWGDIDTHGFAILDRLRAALPDVRSFLMDRATLLAHRSQWVEEGVAYGGSLPHLDASEQALFQDLREHTLGNRIRLEQERVSYHFILDALKAIARNPE